MRMTEYGEVSYMSHWMLESWGGGLSPAPLISATAVPGSSIWDDDDQAWPEGEGAEIRRWRRVVLHMTDRFSAAAVAQPHLSPYLMEAMGHALEQLLLFGRERDLIALDEWLNEDVYHSAA